MPKRFVSRLVRLALWLSVACLVASCRAPAQPSSSAAGDLEAFADGFFPAHMRELHIAGLVVIVVRDGEILLAKGYGLANVARRVVVDPNGTLFRIGSVSKPFVAAAVMQLIERGVLDLHEDVNRYLTTFQVANPYPEPVTLAALLTHSAGIQDPPYQSNVDPLARQPLGEYLAQHLPPVTARPGSESAYSSHGYALAAWVVEEVTCVPFDRYVAEQILQPLSMSHTSYLLEPPLPAGLATGYTYPRGYYVAQPLDYDHDYPGGSLVATAGDMAHFMIAQLEGGCYRSSCILDAATVDEMQRLRVPVPGGSQGQTYGFHEAQLNGLRVVGHTGAIRGFGSSLDLLPEKGVAYFLAFNAECWQSSACDIISPFRREFVQRFAGP